MQRCDTLISVDWCIPVEPDRLVLENVSVAIADGRIVGILPTDEAPGSFEAGAVVDRPGHVLVPGFVNAHTHAAMTLMRGLADDLPLHRWLKEAVWPAEARWVGAEMVRDGTRLAIAEMLLSGSTCFSDQYYFPEIVAETAADMNMRAVIGTPVTEYATAWAATPAECLAKGAELVHDPFAEHPLVSTCFAPHSALTVADGTFADLRVLADQLDKPIQMHLHESLDEIESSVAECGRRPLQRLEDLGMVNSSLLAVHAVHVNDAEIQLLAESGVAVAHCPRSNLKLADGIAAAQDLLDAGITVGLGTDGAASNNVLDMPGEMRTAALLAKARAGRAEALPAASALRMATLDGAAALGIDSVTGSIEPGKWADLACIDLMHVNSQPVYDPISQVVYTVQPHQVRDVWVAGRHQVEGGQLTLIDTQEIVRRTSEWRQRMSSGEDTFNK
jgi:5-methylthioadenosine/S-adenosylhomocysteine deaminase